MPTRRQIQRSNGRTRVSNAPPGLRSPDLPAPQDVMQVTADFIQKAIRTGRMGGMGMGPAPTARPQFINHDQSGAVRRYASMWANGIIERAGPHLDQYVLRLLATKNSVMPAVINTILGQAANHFKPPRYEGDVGFKITQKDQDAAVTKGSAKEADYILNVLMKGGVPSKNPETGEVRPWDGHYLREGQTLRDNVQMMLWDSMVLDRTMVVREASEKIGGIRKHPIMYWGLEDGALMRKIYPGRYTARWRPGEDRKIKYVQLDPGSQGSSIIREYTWEDGAMCIRNPRPDFLQMGYGISEIEQCLDAITGVIQAGRANSEWFTDNKVPQGFINLVGQYGPRAVEEFELKLTQDVGGPGGYWEVPVIHTAAGAGAGATFVPFIDRSRMDMQFRAYIEFSVAIAAAVFQISPAEFGFPDFGEKSGLQESDPESTFQQSQHKGLLPKVFWVRDVLQNEIVEFINPDFQIEIVGLNSGMATAALAEAELDQARLASGWSPNDIRRQKDEPIFVNPLNKELWKSLVQQHKEEWYANESSRQAAIIDEYESQGGELGDCYEVPAGCQGAMEVWEAQNLQQQQNAEEQMNTTAQGEVDAQRQDEQAQQQSVRDQMGNQVATEDERAYAEDQQDAENAKSGTVQVPGLDDAGALRRPVPGKQPPPGGAPGGKPGGAPAGRPFSKAVVVRRFGPWPEEAAADPEEAPGAPDP